MELSWLGETAQLSGSVRDRSGRVLADAARSWTSEDPEVATVSPEGTVTAVGNGITRVSLTSDGVSASATITVAQLPTLVTVSGPPESLDALGDTLSLAAAVWDAGGSAVEGATVRWSSSDEQVARVDSTGLVTSVDNGTATVTAASGSIAGQAEVTVAQRPATLQISVGAVALDNPGDSVVLQATVRDPLGVEVVHAVPIWESGDPAVATVDAEGVVRGVTRGAAWIRARAGTAVDSARVHVSAPLLLLSGSPPPSSAQVTSELVLSARVEDAAGNPRPGAVVRWTTLPGSGALVSSSETVSDAAGSVSAVWQLGTGAGNQVARATMDTQGETVVVDFPVDATPGPATTLALTADSILLNGPGEAALLSPTVHDAWGNSLSPDAVAWSGDAAWVATVAVDGLVTAVGAGSTWVTAALDALQDSILVTVELRGAITLTFDDAWRTTYDQAWPVLQEFPGLRANVGVYTEAIGWDSYLGEAHLDELHEAGWSMVSHSVSHDSLSTLSAAELDHELRASREWLEARGYRGSHVFIAPYHDFGDRERTAASGHYVAARGVSATETVPATLEGWMPTRPMHLTGVEADLLPYTTPEGRERLRAFLQRTVDEGAFVDLFFHQVPPDRADAFRALLQVVWDFRDRVLPYHELFPLAPRVVR